MQSLTYELGVDFVNYDLACTWCLAGHEFIDSNARLIYQTERIYYQKTFESVFGRDSIVNVHHTASSTH